MNPKTELPWSLRASSVCLASFRCELRFLVSAAWSLVEVFLFQAGGAGFNYLRLRGSMIVPFCGWMVIGCEASSSDLWSSSSEGCDAVVVCQVLFF